MKESPNAMRAWADYLALGPDRSFEALLRRYQTAIDSVPTRRLKTLADWSRTFGWQQRLRDIADAVAKEAVEREAAYRRSIMEDGYALAHERVNALKLLAVEMMADLVERNQRWVKEPKLLGHGESAELVELEKFNAAEVEQLRGVLDDIAKEKMERRDVKVLMGEKDKPLKILVEYIDTDPAETSPSP